MSVGEVFNDFVNEAKMLVSSAEKEGIPLRMVGVLAIYIHCPDFQSYYEHMKRPPTDIDLVTYSTHREKLPEFLEKKGYVPDKWIMKSWFARDRHIYYSKTGKKLDIFFDKLSFNHEIDLRGKLHLDTPTLTLANLLLSKMQIVKINEKDIKDTIILIREHSLGNTDNDVINIEYIAQLLSKDWGFYYTVVTNLKKVKSWLNNFEWLKKDDIKDVEMKINKMIDIIEKKPKSLGWKLRARIGTSKKWYNEVEEVVR